MTHDCGDCRSLERRGISRRAMLQTSVGGFLGFAMARQSELLGAPQPGLFLANGNARRSARAVIVLWMSGGPSQYETWDPKPGVPNGGPTRAMTTSVKGIQYAENLPTVARQAHHIAAIRGFTTKEGSHERGRYLLHTGYLPTGTVVHPSFGAVASMELGERNLDLPHYISIGGRAEGAGFLPPDFNPFTVDNPGNKLPDLGYPSGVTSDRFRARMRFLKEQEKDFARERASDETEKHASAYDKADRLMHTPLLEAFDLSKEPADLVAAYNGENKDNRFGKGCLLARRLVERGVRFVEVNLSGWDTHSNNFQAVSRLCKNLDPGMGTLIADLNQRGLLEETLVVWAGEFGRTPKINNNNGRDHYPKVWSVALAGGGIQGGRVIGSSDKDGVEVKERPVTVPDLFATMYTVLGVDHKKKNISPLGRPIQISDNGIPVKELLV
jgi:hypothetical protein